LFRWVVGPAFRFGCRSHGLDPTPNPKETLVQTLIRPARAALALATAVAALAPAAATAAPPAAWQKTAPMAVDHTRAAVTTLADGRGLLIGGDSDVVERFDPATGAWTTVAPEPSPSTDAVATRLADGRVLVTGGGDSGSGYSNRAELYDPVADSWSTAAPMSVGRAYHTASLLPDGTVLVAGGRTLSGPTAGAERFDPATGTWAPVAPMADPRGDHSAATMPDGSVVVAGGISTSGPIAGVERFDPALATWSPLTPLPGRRNGHASVALPDGSLLAIGGIRQMSDAYGIARLDPATGIWKTVPGAPRDSSPGAVVLPGGLVLVVGRQSSSLYDPASDRAVPAGGTADWHYLPRPIVLGDGSVLLADSGYDDKKVAERFVARAVADVAPADFGEQTTGRRGAVVQVPVTTGGDVPLLLRGTEIEGPAAADFAIVSDGCSGELLATGRTCFVGVRFTPGADGARTASLVLRGNELDGGRATVALSGTGVAAPGSQPPPPPTGGRPRRAAATPALRCSARTGRRVRCTGVPRSLGSGNVRLSRSGIVHATGTLKNGRLTLTVRRRLFDRRYTLVVGGRRALKVVLD
jgi:Galactose oxidase, central domain/Kelch motif